MKEMKIAGNFKELRHGDKKGPSIYECVSDTPHPFEKELLSYLQHGILLAGCVGPARDVLAKTPMLIDPPHLLTDGTWLWHADLIYYVQRYHCRLPEEFVAHMRHRNWQPPREEEVNLQEILQKEN